jgi:hypothetical protein
VLLLSVFDAFPAPAEHMNLTIGLVQGLTTDSARKAWQHYTTQVEAAVQDAAVRNTAVHDAAVHDAAVQNTAVQDAVVQDAPVHHTAAQDAVERTSQLPSIHEQKTLGRSSNPEQRPLARPPNPGHNRKRVHDPGGFRHENPGLKRKQRTEPPGMQGHDVKASNIPERPFQGVPSSTTHDMSCPPLAGDAPGFSLLGDRQGEGEQGEADYETRYDTVGAVVVDSAGTSHSPPLWHPQVASTFQRLVSCFLCMSKYSAY